MKLKKEQKIHFRNNTKSLFEADRNILKTNEDVLKMNKKMNKDVLRINKNILKSLLMFVFVSPFLTKDSQAGQPSGTEYIVDAGTISASSCATSMLNHDIPSSLSKKTCTVTAGNQRICGGGDITPQAINVWDGDVYEGEGQFYDDVKGAGVNGLVYRIERNRYGKWTVTTNVALIPGHYYRYVMHWGYYGDTVHYNTCEYKRSQYKHKNDGCTTSCNKDGVCSTSCTPCSHKQDVWVWKSGEVYTQKIYSTFTIKKNFSTVSNGNDYKTYYGINYEYNYSSHYDRLFTDTRVADYGNGMDNGRYSDVLMYEHPYTSLSASIWKVDYSKSNSNTGNDSMSTVIQNAYDISVSNVVVTPSTYYVDTTNGNKITLKVNVSYDVLFDIPNANRSWYYTDVQTLIKINGQEKYVRDFLNGDANVSSTKTKRSNTQINHVFEVTVPAGTTSIPVTVHVNNDRQVYENSTGSTNVYNNNTSTTKYISINSVRSPFSSAISSVNGNCATQVNKITWTTTHRVTTWSTKTIYYRRIGNSSVYSWNTSQSLSGNGYGHSTNYGASSYSGPTRPLSSGYTVDRKSRTGTSKSFSRFNSPTVGYSVISASSPYYETLNITSIMFRSKETTDNKCGTSKDGWIDLLNSSTLSSTCKAVVKAGYGFELKVKTQYTTNALSNQPSEATRKQVTALNGSPNFGLEDIFIELPGKVNNSKTILSATGYSGTQKVLDVVANKSNVENATWTYSLSQYNSIYSGKTAGKIYVPENMKDGSYTISIFTPPMTGVTHPSKGSSVLCARKTINVQVLGSNVDDLNGHYTQ